MTEPIVIAPLSAPANLELRFHTTDEVASFIRSERDAWKWLGQNGVPQNVRSLWGQVHQEFSTIDQLVARASAQPEEQRAPSYKAITTHLNTAFSQRKFPTSNSTIGQFILSLQSRDAELAGYVLGYVSDTAIDYRSAKAIKACILTENFHTGWQGYPEAAKDALEKLVSEYRPIVENAKVANADLAITSKEILQSIDADKNSYSNQFAQFVADATAQREALLQKGQTDLTALEKTFREGLRLRAPALYWSKKANQHSIGIALYTALAISFGFAFFAFLAIEVDRFLRPHFALGPSSYWAIGLIAMTSLLGIWGLRLITRMLLSHAHLSADASERDILIQTYLSLTESGQGVKDSDRQLILSAIFRHATKGILKEDAFPPLASHLLDKVMK